MNDSFRDYGEGTVDEDQSGEEEPGDDLSEEGRNDTERRQEKCNYDEM